MTFSELDFAQLRLAAGTDHGISALLPQYPHNGGSMAENLDQALFCRQLPDYNPSTALDATASPLLIDPNLGHYPSWQEPSFQPQTNAAAPSAAETSSRSELSTSWTSSRGSSGNYQYHPVAENQQPGFPRRRSQYFRSQPRPTLPPPIDIPGATPVGGLSDPMQRWRDSPPEAEPASLSAIADALGKTPLRTRSSAGSLNRQRIGSRAASTVSFGSGTSCSSASNVSASSVALRATADRSRGRVAKRARTTMAKGKQKGGKKRIFPCTFCCDSFESKYDWARHEKSLHLNLQEWQCAPFGGIVVSSDTGRAHCAYCSLLDPSAEHLDSHNHGACANEGQPPTFSRKDHLVQHLRLVHYIDTLPLVDSWKDEGSPISSRCGFCSIRMQTWQERLDHLTTHFRKGLTMDAWSGEHQFEPWVAVKVTHAIPPYLIGSESKALVPFSVTSHGTRDHLSQIQRATEQRGESWDAEQITMPVSGSETSPESATQPGPLDTIDDDDTSGMTYPEVLALHLGRYAQQQMKLGIIPTDRMFQQEARRIMFDSVDPWDQTIADNNDWLSLFRDRHLKDAPASQKGSN